MTDSKMRFRPVPPKKQPSPLGRPRRQLFPDLIDLMGRPALYDIGGGGQATSEDWARERAQRAEASPLKAVKIALPEHKLAGGENTEAGRQIAETVAAIEAKQAAKEAAEAHEVELVEKTAEKLVKPRRRRKR